MFRNHFIAQLLILSTLSIVAAAPAFAKKLKQPVESPVENADANIKNLVEQIPKYKPFEAAALNREAMIGMPDALFGLVMTSWSCEDHVTEYGNHYRTQWVCYHSQSKKGEYQGRYFYTEGEVRRSKSGNKVFVGKLVSVQNK